MTVKELIEKLEQYPDFYEVTFPVDPFKSRGVDYVRISVNFERAVDLISTSSFRVVK